MNAQPPAETTSCEAALYFPEAVIVPYSLSLLPFFKNQSFLRERAMHIYYAAKGLRGKPYHSDIINKDLFTF